MITLSPDQRSYIESSLERNTYLCACPGAGKTEVIAAKIALEIRRWPHFPAGMAVLSFSRSATEELSDRIAKVRCGNTNAFPHFIGTVDSFILKHIVTPLAHLLTGYPGRNGDYALRIIGPEALNLYRTKYAIEHQHFAANRFDWDSIQERFCFWHPSDPVRRKLNTLVLEPWQIAHLHEVKQRFNSAGFATYKDVERFAIQILSEPKFKARVELFTNRFPSIIIDECQDLSGEQIAIFTCLADMGVTFHLVGDLNQAIYGFRNCVPDITKDFITRIGCLEISLTENHRSGQSIVDLHGKLVNAEKIQGKPNNAPVTCYLLEYIDCPSEVLVQFDALAAKHNSPVIVARGHSTLEKLRATNIEQSPVNLLATSIATFLSDSPKALHAALSTFARYLAENCIDCDTMGEDLFFRPTDIESAEVWHQFLSDCLTELASRGLGNQDVTWKSWCKKMREVLPCLATIVCHDTNSQRILATLQKKKHPAPAGLGAVKVLNSTTNAPNLIKDRRLATIHEVKGETHDVTMLVSSMKPGEASHWKEWINDPQSEAARFAYVASSRPRHILIWAVKAVNAADRKKLFALGLQTYVT